MKSLNQFRDHAIILRNLNLLMIDAKHESLYNYTEIVVSNGGGAFMGGFL